MSWSWPCITARVYGEVGRNTAPAIVNALIYRNAGNIQKVMRFQST